MKITITQKKKKAMGKLTSFHNNFDENINLNINNKNDKGNHLFIKWFG